MPVATVTASAATQLAPDSPRSCHRTGDPDVDVGSGLKTGPYSPPREILAPQQRTTGGHMRTHIATAAAALLTCSLAVSGQQPPAAGAPAAAPQAGGGRGQQGPQGPQVVSPEVNADRTVTLRLLAPKATEVTVTGEILNGAQPKPMTKGEEGIWTATMPAVPADIYTYAFNVDGVNTPDPRNPWVKLVSGTGLASQ